MKLWYVEDEVGNAIRASEEPTAAVGLLVCILLAGQAFSVLFLTQDLEQGMPCASAR